MLSKLVQLIQLQLQGLEMQRDALQMQILNILKTASVINLQPPAGK